jgi:hypothetical protein
VTNPDLDELSELYRVAPLGVKPPVILYANPGTEPFYANLGFLPMVTAMAIWDDQAHAVSAGLLRVLP